MRIDRIAARVEMLKRDIKIKDLCKISGLSRMTVSSVLNGKSCKEDTALRIAAGLGVDLSEIAEVKE